MCLCIVKVAFYLHLTPIWKIRYSTTSTAYSKLHALPISINFTTSAVIFGLEQFLQMLISLALAQSLIYTNISEEGTELLLLCTVHLIDKTSLWFGPVLWLSIFKCSTSPAEPLQFPTFYCLYLLLSEIAKVGKQGRITNIYTVLKYSGESNCVTNTLQTSSCRDLFSEFPRERWELNCTPHTVQQSPSETKERLRVCFKYANRTKPDI